MDAETFLGIHQALHGPVPVLRLEGRMYSVEYVQGEENLFKRFIVGDSVFATQNIRKDSPNTTWVCESPQTRHITWWLSASRDHSYRGKVVSHTDDPGYVHVNMMLFYKGNKTHVLMDDHFPLLR